MAGYLDRPDLTNQVLHDGWYSTGDLAVIYEDGAIEIAGRLSRFAKIGGEMIPLERVEQTLTACVADETAGEGPPLAVVAVADEARGERLIVVHRPLPKRPADLRREIIAAGLPPIFAPAASDFIEVERLPLTATGKLDVARIEEWAERAMAARRHFAKSEASA